MKVLPFKIPKPENEALIYQEDIEDIFYNRLHQHEEIQLSFIKNGEGTLVIGDSISNFKTGDIIVIGSNLPHAFNSEFKQDEKSIMLSLFFSKNSFGQGFFELNELKELSSFFKISKYGFKVKSNQKAIVTQFEKLDSESKLNRFISFFKIIQIINSSNHKQLSSFIYEKSLKDNEGKRMSAVFEYTMKKFNQPISLAQISFVANMTTNSFCKYFKQRTNKTYFQILNEIRIENACKLLYKERDLTMTDVAAQSGFPNISNFNRKFKLVKKMTPTNYRKLSV